MEQINKVELRGFVGNVTIRKVGERRVAHFSVGTAYAYNDRGGNAVIDTQWHNVNAWESKNITCLDQIEKGGRVQVTGRLIYRKYTSTDGIERTTAEIQAYKLKIIDSDDDVFQCEM